MRLPERLRARPEPGALLAAIVAVQLLAVLAFALAAAHNGWLYYHGGDQLWYYTGAWLLDGGTLPPTEVGYGWSVLLMPAALLGGLSYLAALPAIVLVQIVVLVPLGTVLMYLTGRALAGAWFGLWAAALWAFAPFAVIPLFVDRYHERYVDLVLPQLFGFTGLADFPSAVCLLAAALFTIRALQRRALDDAVLAGLLTGFAVGLKPSNALFLAAPFAALAAARHWRPLLAFGLATLPALLTLALWKYRGLGTLPVFAASSARLAAGSGTVAALDVGQYVDLDFHHLKDNLAQVREFFWSARLLEFVPIAGTIAFLRRSLPFALLIGIWFWSMLLVKGTYGLSTVESGSFFRFLMPAFPAYVLFGASLLLLVPTVGARLPARVPGAGPIDRRLLGVAAALLVVVPLLIVGLARPLQTARAVAMQEEGTFVPVTDDLRLSAERDGDSLLLSWAKPPSGSTSVYYRLFRNDLDDDLACSEDGARQCILYGDPFDTVAGTRQEVPRLPGVYRVGMAASWRNEFRGGETLLLGPPLVIR